ncbi:MAG: hypothetical protein IJF82_20795 [Achromobacter sp.]|nr:hypothetical protein [Achromobacter sp.]MBQ3612712.1 hypothetical protein [Bacteroidales bacterium]
MNRLIDTGELKHELKWLEDDTPVYHDVMSTIDDAPAVDAVEVVRCKDCKYYWKNSVMTNVPLCLASPRDDAFCSEGKREEERLIMPKADGSTIPKDYMDEVAK